MIALSNVTKLVLLGIVPEDWFDNQETRVIADIACPACGQSIQVQDHPGGDHSEDGGAWREEFYSGIACFVSGALLGIALGLYPD